ncbi:MAG: SRPBCC family protein, partial [Gemmobacter sp.]|nr:SRPBCC family protein [Gemmobacter sp.]
MANTTRSSDQKRAALLAVIGAALVSASVIGVRAAARANVPRQPDSAPGRTARRRRFGDYAVTGRSVTINRPRQDIYEFWRHFANLPSFMENVDSVEESGDETHWTIKAPAGQSVVLKTRITDDRPGESIAWRSVDDSPITAEGKVMLRDAPGDRGTVVTAIIAYVPPGGELGEAVAKLFGREPAIQTRHELKRLKMLLETGEIAT